MSEKDQTAILREAILAEIKAWQLNYPEGSSWHKNLNNFNFYLPSADCTNTGGRLAGRLLAKDGMMDKKMGDLIKEFFGEAHQSNYSQLRLNQTPREFFAEIDKTIVSCIDVSLEKVISLQHLYYQLRTSINIYEGITAEERERMYEIMDKSMQVLKTLYEYALPV